MKTILHIIILIVSALLFSETTKEQVRSKKPHLKVYFYFNKTTDKQVGAE